MDSDELAALEAEVDEILDAYGLAWIRDEVDEHMADAWPAASPAADDREVDRRRAARLVLTLGGAHRTARLLLATEIAVERAEERHTEGRPWLVVDRYDERRILSVPYGLSRGARSTGVRDLGAAANALAAQIAEEFGLPFGARNLGSRAQRESAVAREQGDESTAWLDFVEFDEVRSAFEVDGTLEA